jgi:hypothetical protein
MKDKYNPVFFGYGNECVFILFIFICMTTLPEDIQSQSRWLVRAFKADRLLFSIGAYIGETLLRNAPGAYWKTEDADPEGEITAAIHLPDGTICWPMQRAIKRFRNGSADSIYAYGQAIIPSPLIVKRKKSWWPFGK